MLFKINQFEHINSQTNESRAYSDSSVEKKLLKGHNYICGLFIRKYHYILGKLNCNTECFTEGWEK